MIIEFPLPDFRVVFGYELSVDPERVYLIKKLML